MVAVKNYAGQHTSHLSLFSSGSARTLFPGLGLPRAARRRLLRLGRPLFPRCPLQLFPFRSVFDVLGVHSSLEAILEN